MDGQLQKSNFKSYNYSSHKGTLPYPINTNKDCTKFGEYHPYLIRVARSKVLMKALGPIVSYKENEVLWIQPLSCNSCLGQVRYAEY